MAKVDLDKICEFISDPANHRIAILTHISPDGDCIGSAAGLSGVLKKMGRDAKIYQIDPFPSNLEFLKSYAEFLPESETESPHDLVICVDTGSVDRINDRLQIFESGRATMVIDHHMTNTYFCDYSYVDAAAAANTEIIYLIAKKLGVEICEEIATPLYVGIITDTGSFKYSSTTDRTFDIARKLKEAGIDLTKINNEVFLSITRGSVQALRICLDNLKFYFDGRVAASHITYEDIKNHNLDQADTDGLSEYLRSIMGVEVGAFARGTDDNKYKFSTRSKTYVDVSEVAGSLGGGGHKRAAGFRTSKKYEEALEIWLEKINEQL